jgi:hypothetical protein
MVLLVLRYGMGATLLSQRTGMSLKEAKQFREVCEQDMRLVAFTNPNQP